MLSCVERSVHITAVFKLSFAKLNYFFKISLISYHKLFMCYSVNLLFNTIFFFFFTFQESSIWQFCLSSKTSIMLLKCLPVLDMVRAAHLGFYCHNNWESSQLISLLFHPILIRQDDRSMPSCLVEHFTLAAFCYLLILASSLLSIAFHLSFIFFNHVHAPHLLSLRIFFC